MTLTPRDKQNLKTFGYGVLAVLAGGLIYLLCLAACFWQSRYGVESETAIEWVQDIVLLISMGSFFTLAKLIPEERGGILLMAGFMTSLFIREQDAYFDFISKSAWQIGSRGLPRDPFLGAYGSGGFRKRSKASRISSAPSLLSP